MKQRKKKHTKINVIAIVLVLCAAVCGAFFGYRATKQKSVNVKYQELAENATDIQPEKEEEKEGILEELNIPVPDKNINWDMVKAENPDIYAWIYIPNTNVDYPVLQHPTDDEYYLNHNIDGSEGYPGCIYSESVNKKDFSDPNTVLYGHDMNDGSMFSTLHNFEDNQFFNENCYIYIYTPEKTFVYQIYSASEFGDQHIMYAYDFQTETGFNQFIADIGNSRDMASHKRDGIGMGYGRKLLTLSTCIATKPENRWLVTAVLMNEE